MRILGINVAMLALGSIDVFYMLRKNVLQPLKWPVIFHPMLSILKSYLWMMSCDAIKIEFS